MSVDMFIQKVVTDHAQHTARFPTTHQLKPSICNDILTSTDWLILIEYVRILKLFQTATKHLEGRAEKGITESLLLYLKALEGLTDVTGYLRLVRRYLRGPTNT